MLVTKMSPPSPDAAKKPRRTFGRALRSLVAGLVVAVAVFALIRTKDMPPDGPTCWWSDEPQSSGMGLGTERTDWTPLPIKVCDDGGEGDPSGDGFLWVVAGFAGMIGGAFAYDRLGERDRRRAKRLAFSRIAEEALIPWREESYDTLLALVDKPVHDLVRSPDGEALHLGVSAVIDHPATQDVRVIAAVDDGEKGVLGWVHPGCADFIKRSDGSFIGE